MGGGAAFLGVLVSGRRVQGGGFVLSSHVLFLPDLAAHSLPSFEGQNALSRGKTADAKKSAEPLCGRARLIMLPAKTTAVKISKDATHERCARVRPCSMTTHRRGGKRKEERR